VDASLFSTGCRVSSIRCGSGGGADDVSFMCRALVVASHSLDEHKIGDKQGNRLVRTRQAGVQKSPLNHFSIEPQRENRLGAPRRFEKCLNAEFRRPPRCGCLDWRRTGAVPSSHVKPRSATGKSFLRGCGSARGQIHRPRARTSRTASYRRPSGVRGSRLPSSPAGNTSARCALSFAPPVAGLRLRRRGSGARADE